MVRYGLIGSVVLHLIVFGLVIFNFAGGKTSDPQPPQPPVAVEVMSPRDYSERQAGKTDGKAAKPAPPAEIKAEEAPATAKKDAELKPTLKPVEREAMPPPPKAAEAAPKPVEKPRIEKAELPPEKPVHKPAAKKDPERKPIAKAKPDEPRKAEEPEPKRAELKPEPKPAPDRQFDPNRIASLLQKDKPQDERAPASQTMTDAPPSRNFSDRQTAVLNRDPNAGVRSGAYEPNQPWRRASSLQDQAMGLPTANGQMNAGSCAEVVQKKIEDNWILPVGGVGAETSVIRLRIELRPDGTLSRPPTVMERPDSPTERAMADAAIRAAEQGQPYRIPAEQYERCRDMVLRFNPRDMYGG